MLEVDRRGQKRTEEDSGVSPNRHPGPRGKSGDGRSVLSSCSFPGRLSEVELLEPPVHGPHELAERGDVEREERAVLHGGEQRPIALEPSQDRGRVLLDRGARSRC